MKSKLQNIPPEVMQDLSRLATLVDRVLIQGHQVMLSPARGKNGEIIPNVIEVTDETDADEILATFLGRNGRADTESLSQWWDHWDWTDSGIARIREDYK